MTINFKSICIEDKLYKISIDNVIPTITKHFITGIKQNNHGNLTIHTKEFYVIIDVNNINTNQENNTYFLSKSDSYAALEKLCLDRILDLCNAIGDINAAI